MSNNFKIDTGDYLGIKYESFKDEMLALALAEPSEYFHPGSLSSPIYLFFYRYRFFFNRYRVYIGKFDF